MLLPRLDLTEGKIVVLGAHAELPCDNVERLQESVAHLDVLDEQDRAAALLELLKSLEATVGKIIVIVEDYLLSPQDKYTQSLVAANSVVVARGTVFHICDVTSLGTPKDVSERCSGGFEWPLNIFILSAEAARSFGDLVERQDAAPLVDALVGTVHAIYDAEGYIAWIRRDRPT
jgi:hypothetical protein